MGEPQEMPNWTNQPADQYRNFGLTNRKDYGLRDYRFSVTIENLRDVNYFTEKLIDCFLTGTVPIYWGCPNIESFFDTRGMVIVDNLTDIVNAVNNLTTEDYDRMLPFIRKNYETAQNYNFVWDRVAEVLKELK
jgi:hypothetical protein